MLADECCLEAEGKNAAAEGERTGSSGGRVSIFALDWRPCRQGDRIFLDALL